ncbi:MAG: Ig-like domain-containing protein [Pseudomonadota bacterium]
MPSEKIQVAIEHPSTTFAAPPAIVGGALDDAGDIQNPIAHGGVTDDRQPGFHGQGTPGDTIVVRDNGNEIGTTEVGEDGTWTFTPSTDLIEGLHAITIVARDGSGNEGTPSPAFNFEIDVTPPDASRLAVTGVADTVGGVTGNVTPGASTDDTRPLLSGISTGVPGHTVTVMVKDAAGTRELGQATIGENGKWTFQVDTPLAAGPNTFMLVERDAAGNETMPTGRYQVNIETGRPEAPVIQNVKDDVGEVHMLQKGEVTDDARPTIIGTAQAGTTVKVYDNGTYLGETVTDPAGTWRFTPEASLADGPHDITATATNTLGQTSDATGIWNFSVDTQPPGQITGLEVIDDVGGKTGPLSNGDTTDDNKPTFNGKAEPGTTVNVYDNGVKLGSAPVDANGNWTFTPTSPLADGPHALTTEVMDPAGNSSGRGEPLNLVIDTKGVPVSIDRVMDDQGSVKGPIAADGTTDDPRPEIQGLGKAGSTIKVYASGYFLGSTVVQPDGTWSFTPSVDMAQGRHNITATATDLAGNVSDPTPVFGFTIDTVAPNTPTIDAVADDVGTKQGLLANGGVTDDPSPTLSGKAEPGSTLTVYDDAIKLGTVVTDSRGNWSYTPTSPLAEGEHKFTVTATDKAGNVSAPSSEFVLSTDYTPPDASKLAITGVDDDVGGIVGNVTSGETTDDSLPTINGTGTAGNTILVTVKDNTGSHKLQPVVVDQDGKWTLQVQTPLADGPNEFTAIEQDKAGNQTAPSASYVVDVNTDRPTAPVIKTVYDDEGVAHMLQQGEVTNDAKPTFSGTAQPNHTVKLYDGAAYLGTVVADANGNWSFTPETALAEGTRNITATSTNPVGQTSDASATWSFVVDTVAPAAPTIVSVFDDAGKLTGNLNSGEKTDDANPQISGQAEPNTIVIIKSNGKEIGRVPVDTFGAWSFTPKSSLGNGIHDLTATALDEAGNIGEPSKGFSLFVSTYGDNGLENFNELKTNLSGTKLPSGVTVTGTFNFTQEGNGYQPGGVPISDRNNGLWVLDNSTVKLELPSPSTVVSFFHTAETTGHVVSYFDDQGILLGKITLMSGGGSLFREVSFASGEGKLISSIAINAIDDLASGFIVENLSWGNGIPESIEISSIKPNESGSVVIQGTYTGASKINENVLIQVSTDGGATWSNTVASQGKWVFLAMQAPQGEWDAQVRAIDRESGLSLGLSDSTTVAPLDGRTFEAPSIVRIPDAEGLYTYTKAQDGSQVLLSLAGTGAKAGDTVHIQWGMSTYDQVLTQLDINTGLATINVPSTVTYSYQGYAKDFTVTAQIVGKDGAIGAVSKPYEVVGTAALTMASDTLQKAPVGDMYTGTGFKVTTTGSLSYKAATTTTLAGLTLSDATQANALFTLDKPANYFTLRLTGIDNAMGAQIQVFDVKGNLIHTENFIGGTDARHTKTFTYTSAELVDIGSFKVISLSPSVTLDAFSQQVVNHVAETRDPNLIEYAPETFYGGTGNDVVSLSVSATTYFNQATAGIHGGSGIDTLKLEGYAHVLDLTKMGGKLSSIEIIDITGSYYNTLTLSLAEVLNNGGVDLFYKGDKSRVQMMVKGNADDIVNLSDLLAESGADMGDWVKKSSVTVQGVVYDVYQFSTLAAELLVQQGVTVKVSNATIKTFNVAFESDDALTQSIHGGGVLDHSTHGYTAGDDTIIAKLGFADRLSGGAGNDAFMNVGTGDTVHGGSGDDTIRINSGDFARVDGGLGIDTLVMDGKAMHIDLSAFGLKIQGIEKFDLGAGGNTLALHASDVLAGGARDMVMADGKVQMLVNGANGDVNLLGGNDSWTQGDVATVGGVTYSVYTNLAGTAELLVEDKVHVTIL